MPCSESTHVAFAPADRPPRLPQALLLGWVGGEVYEEQLEGVALLGLVGVEHIDGNRQAVVAALLGRLQGLERSAPLAVSIVETFGLLEADSDEVANPPHPLSAAAAWLRSPSAPNGHPMVLPRR